MFALKTSLLALAISVSSHVDALPLKPDLSLSAGFDTIVCPVSRFSLKARVSTDEWNLDWTTHLAGVLSRYCPRNISGSSLDLPRQFLRRHLARLRTRRASFSNPAISHIASHLTLPLFQSTTGTCNTGGSTRTFSTQGLTLTEKLGFNYGSYSNPLSWEILFAQGFELLHEPIVQEAVVSKVHDLLVVSKCGSDTQISWEVIGKSNPLYRLRGELTRISGCSNNTATASLIFSTVHGGAVNGTIEYFS